MDIKQTKINKHKINIINLAMKLSNTFNINEEISINNEIKKETEFLQTLLDIKNQQNIQEPMNPMIQKQMMKQQQMLYQQIQQEMIQQRMMMVEQRMIQQPMNMPDYGWILFFEDQSQNSIESIKISEQKLVKEAIALYMQKTGKNGHYQFIFNHQELYPELKICQSGLSNFSKIMVIESENIMVG